MSKMDANFLFPGWTFPLAQGIGNYPKRTFKSLERTQGSCSDPQYLEITSLEETQGMWVILGNWWEP